MTTARGTPNLGQARALALLVPAALLAGAWSFQIWGGLFPCEMCWYQRYAHLVAFAFAIVALAAARSPRVGLAFLLLAALAILVSGGIGVYHAGCEAHFYRCLTQCTQTDTSTAHSTEELMTQIMNRPLIRCDEVQWRDPVLGVSMAGWNAILSIGFGLLILWLTQRHRRAAA